MRTKQKPKTSLTVEQVREAAGKTWFEFRDENDYSIEITSRDHGDICDETPGKKDIEEGKRILKAVRKKFPLSRWSSDFDVVDEWVSVNIRKTGYTAAEKAAMKQKKEMAKLEESIKEALREVNEATKKEGCRASFSGFVYDGHDYFKPSFKVQFGVRLLYHDHLGAGFVYADEAAAQEAIGRILEKFPGHGWIRTCREAAPRHTGNYPPPNNVIERAGYIEYEYRIPKAGGR